MSRCYPYPPPGYQKKAQLQEVSVPAKVVPKEKKKNKEKEKKVENLDQLKEKKVKDLEQLKEKQVKDLEQLKDKKVKDLEQLKDKKVKDLEQVKEKKGKDSEKEKANDIEKDRKAKESEKEKKAKDTEKEKKVKDSEKVKDKEKRVHEATPKEKKAKEKSKDKEKEKRDKDKKDKRKKDGETNGVIHDKDPRSSKLRRTSLANDVLHSSAENGGVIEIKTTAAVAIPLDRDGRDAAKCHGSSDGPGTVPPSMYIKKEQPNGKADPTLPPLVLSKPVGGRPPDGEAALSSRPSNHNHHIDSNNVGSQRPQKLPDFSICDTLPQHGSWSTLDDEDWLRPPSECVHPQPKAKVEEDSSQQVWAEAVYLPPVDMYALPYVVPY